MKRFVQLTLVVIAFASLARGQELTLQIELPDTQLLLPPASAPVLQTEGVNLPSEEMLIQELLTLIGSSDFETALNVLTDRREELIGLLESGDPQNELAVMAVPGGINFGLGTGLVSSAMLYVSGHVYFSLERFDAAELAFTAALSVMPDYMRAHEALGLLYMRTERFAEARTHFTRAAALGFNTPGLYAALGYINSQTENYWGSVGAFQQALMMEPDNASWQRGLLHALTQTNQYQSGYALVELMLQSDPDEADLWVYRSHLALMSERREQALASLETAIRLGEQTLTNLQACATLHMEHGSIARAVELLGSAYAEGLEYQYLDQALAWLVQVSEWNRVGELLGAAQARRDSLSDEDHSRFLVREASLYRNNGETAAAAAAWQEAIELDPTNAEGLMALGQYYHEERDFGRAEIFFQRAGAFDSYRENSLLSRAQLAIDQENFERALGLLREVIAVNPTRTDLQRAIETLENLTLLREEV